MVFFITFLKAIAACLITNAHYTGIYPTDIIANGGIIGDVIFFAVSGYCLANIKKSFPVWYSKRIVRCYLPVVLMTVIFTALYDGWSISNFVDNWGSYPTYYHFVETIVLLYILFYIIMYIKPLKARLPLLMGIVALVYLVVYIVFYDKSYYHIDSVSEPMIRFLFMEAMLLGAYFKEKSEEYKDKFSFKALIGAVVSFVAYFGSKLFFSSVEGFSQYQAVNQLLVLILLGFIFRFAMGMDDKLEKLPAFIKAVISFVAKITLDIYVVQYALIDFIRPKLSFPVNWIVLTASILVSAAALHYACDGILKLYAIIKNKIKNKIKGT